MSENKTCVIQAYLSQEGVGEEFCVFLKCVGCFWPFLHLLNVLLWLEQVRCSAIICIVFGISLCEIYHVCSQGH